MRLIYALHDPRNPNSLAQRMRRARAKHVRALIDDVFSEKGKCRILDLGGEFTYWKLFEEEYIAARNIHVTMVNLSPGEDIHPSFENLQANACDLKGIFSDNEFDLVHSNSVIEHVGDWDDMEAFAGEVRRLAPRYYVQTPNYWFPIEPHFSEPFFHWRTEQWRARALLKMRPHYDGDLGRAMKRIQSVRLLERGQFAWLFPDAKIVNEQFLGLTKSLIAIKS